MAQVTSQCSREKPADSEVLWERRGQSPHCLGWGGGKGRPASQGEAGEASRGEKGLTVEKTG